MPTLCIIPARALKDDAMTPTQLRVLLAVGTFTSRDGTGVWASNATIAEVAGVHERHMRDALKSLVARGYVRKVSRPGRTAVLAIALDEPLGGPCTDSVQGTPHEIGAPGCTDSVRRTTHITTQGNEHHRPQAKLTHDHHRAAYAAVLHLNPRGRASVDFELQLRAEGGERPGVGPVAPAGWDRVGEALHQLVTAGRAFTPRALGTYLDGLRPADRPALPRTTNNHTATNGFAAYIAEHTGDT